MPDNSVRLVFFLRCRLHITMVEVTQTRRRRMTARMIPQKTPTLVERWNGKLISELRVARDIPGPGLVTSASWNMTAKLYVVL